MKIEIPALCFGEEYQSLTRHPIKDLGSGEELGTLGLVLENRIATDFQRDGKLKKAHGLLRSIPVRDRIRMSVEAADHFESGVLDCGGVTQSAENYNQLVARTSGLSHLLARANTARIAKALRMTESIMNGLSRGLPLDIYDSGLGLQGGATVRLVPQIEGLGCCMPNNSPGVHVTWATSPAFGVPPVVRPGSAEPFTPLRLIQAFIKAGFPKEAFAYYPCDHGGANRIPYLTKGAIVFGSDDTVKQWAGNPMIQLHGAGFSKLILGEDRVEEWRALIPELARNFTANSGRSCYAVSLFIVPRYANEIAEALAEEAAKLVPRSLDHPEALLSAMAMPANAVAVNQSIDVELKKGGATDVSAKFRSTDRLVMFEGRTYLLPTVIRCNSRQHPLANQEFLFPFAAVIEASNEQAFAELDKTLSLAVYTHNESLKRRALESEVSLVSINKGTSELDRCQPHEENLFELFFKRLSYVA